MDKISTKIFAAIMLLMFAFFMGGVGYQNNSSIQNARLMVAPIILIINVIRMQKMLKKDDNNEFHADSLESVFNTLSKFMIIFQILFLIIVVVNITKGYYIIVNIVRILAIVCSAALLIWIKKDIIEMKKRAEERRMEIFSQKNDHERLFKDEMR